MVTASCAETWSDIGAPNATAAVSPAAPWTIWRRFGWNDRERDLVMCVSL
jgi:hypothetical protein